MGLLEQLLARLDTLNARLDALENGQVMKPISVVGETDTPEPVVDLTATAPTVELDKNGIPWDERIHAGTKRKNADSTWSMKKGVDKDLYAEIMAELLSSHAPGQDNGECSAASEPVVQTAPQKPGAPTAPAKPGAPTAPAKPGAPTAPAKPGAPTAPAKPGAPTAPAKPEAAGDTVKAARAANTLVNDFRVDYDDIVETLLKPLGVDAFGSLTMEQATEVLKGLEAWVKSLTDLKEEFDGITKMAEGTEHVTTIAEGLTDFVTTHEGKVNGDIGSVPYANIHALYKEVCEWANQWEEFFKG